MPLLTPQARLIKIFMPSWPELSDDAYQKILSDVAAFLKIEFTLTPWFIALPMALLQILFSTVLTLSGARSQAEQQRVITHWERCGVPFQAFIRLYRSLTLLAYMEHPLIREKLDLPDYQAHQENFRAKRHALLNHMP